MRERNARAVVLMLLALWFAPGRAPAQGPPGLLGLPARVRALENQVAAHARRLSSLQRQVSTQAAGLAGLQQQVAQQGAELAALGQQATALAQQVAGLGGDVAGLAQRVTDAEGQIASLQQGADAFAAQLADLAARMADVEARLAALEAPAGGPRRLTSVDCDAAQSVNAILATLPAGANTVEVSGTCPEDVRVDGFDDLWLIGLSGASLRSLTIEQSRRIQARGFALAPTGAMGVTVRRSSCGLALLTVDGGSAASGFLIDNDSEVSLGLVSASNVRTGLVVARRSTVTLNGSISLEGLFPTAPSDSTSGIQLSGASLLQASLDGSSSLRGFSTGLSTRDNSTAVLVVSGPAGTQLLIDSNRNDGVVATGGSVALLGPVVVSGHPSAGVLAFDGVSVELSQGVRLEGNGTALSLRNNATARIVFGTQLTGNTFGVSARNSSVVDFAGLQIVFGSNATDISCDATSVASRVGLTNATSVNCVNQN